MATFLPEDLVLSEILPKLPLKSLLRFKFVSKNWMTHISGYPFFIDTHRRLQQRSAIILYDDYIKPAPPRQILKVFSDQFSMVKEVDLSYLIEEYGRFEVTSSCGGLVCLRFDDFPDRVVLWNPATRQRRLLPSLTDCNRMWCVGVGLDEVSGDWKVVRLCMESDDPTAEFPNDSLVRAHVLTRGGTIWRDCGVSGIEGTFHFIGMIPVAAAGALHWHFFPGSHLTTGQSNIDGILSFDLTDEVFRYANAPGPQFFTLCSWRSSLAAFTYEGPSSTLNVASPSSCGDGLTWSKLMKFNLHVNYNWREHYLSSYEDEYSTLLLVDPQNPEEVRILDQHFRADNRDFLIFDYEATIVSVF